VTGDLNGDDNLDLVVTSRDDFQQQLLSVLLGHGDGTFAPAMTYNPNGYLPSPALADFNGDGNFDLAGGRQVFLGNGDGTFREPGDIGTDAYYGTKVGDFDRDGNLDLAGTNLGTVSVLRGNGDGTFQPARSFAAGLHPDTVNAADMNGDSVFDLVVKNDPADGVDGGLTVLLGNGEGSFAPPITTTGEAEDQSPTSASPAAPTAVEFRYTQTDCNGPRFLDQWKKRILGFPCPQTCGLSG
jgi:hypothetical protein